MEKANPGGHTPLDPHYSRPQTFAGGVFYGYSRQKAPARKHKAEPMCWAGKVSRTEKAPVRKHKAEYRQRGEW